MRELQVRETGQAHREAYCYAPGFDYYRYFEVKCGQWMYGSFFDSETFVIESTVYVSTGRTYEKHVHIVRNIWIVIK